MTKKKNITTKEKISTLKTSEYSDFEPFWHKKRDIKMDQKWDFPAKKHYSKILKILEGEVIKYIKQQKSTKIMEYRIYRK